MATAKRKGANKYLTIFTLCLGASTTYLLPYLRWTFYDAMIEAFQFTNTELTMCGTVFGIVAMICYFFGGPLCDKVAPKILLTTSYVATGLTGLWFATYPGYGVCLLLHAIWAVTTTLLMWDCMLRVTRTLGSSDEQGRLFGFLEGGRGLITTLVSFALVGIFGALGSSIAGLTGVIVSISVLCIVAGIIGFFVFPGHVETGEEEQKFEIKDMGKVLKNPLIWLIAIMILSCYSVYLGTTYMTPYLTGVLGVSATGAAVVAIFRSYVNQLVGGPVGGIIADKTSIIGTIIALFVIIAITLGVFIVIPAAAPVALPIAIMIIMGFAIFAMRGFYFATIDEVEIPMALSGTAIGVVSFIGFFPDVYMNVLAGRLLDLYPGAAGYQYLFIIMLVFAIIGLIVSIILAGRIKKHKAQKAELQGQD